jgi:hypothetical protein
MKITPRSMSVFGVNTLTKFSAAGRRGELVESPRNEAAKAMNYELQAVLNVLRTTLGPFFVSAILAVLVGVSLASLEFLYPKSRMVDLLRYTHLAPFLLAPILLVHILASLIPLSLAQNTAVLAFFGYVFHAFVAYTILSRVFNWSQRLADLEILIYNVGNHFRDSVALYIGILGSPIAFTTLVLVFLQECMLSTPFLLGKKTLLSLLNTYLQSSTGMESVPGDVAGAADSLRLLFLLVLLFLSALLPIAYVSLKKFGLMYLKHAATGLKRTAHPGAGTSPDREMLLRRRSLVLWMIAGLSSTTQLTILIFAILGLIRGARERSVSASGSLVTFDFIRTFQSPAMYTGLIASLVLVLYLVFGPFAAGTRERNTLSAIDALAMLPPSLFGTVCLLLLPSRDLSNAADLAHGSWAPAVANALGLGGLLGYSFLLVRFFINPTLLRQDLVLLANGKLSRQPPSRIAASMIAGGFGGIGLSLSLAFYFLWIEDGIQISLLSGAQNVAAYVRGLKNSGLSPGTYSGAILGLTVWVAVFGLVSLWTRKRQRIASALLNSKRLQVITCLLFLAYISSPTALLAQACQIGRAVVLQQRPLTLSTPGCETVSIGQLEIPDTRVFAQVLVPRSVRDVKIQKIIFRSTGNTLQFAPSEPTLIKSLQSFRVDEIVANTAQFVDPVNLRFERLRIEDMELQGRASAATKAANPLADNAVNIAIDEKENAAVRRLHLHRILSPEIDISMISESEIIDAPRTNSSKGPSTSKLTSSIHFNGVSSEKIQISSEPKRHCFDDSCKTLPLVTDLELTDVLLIQLDSSRPPDLEIKHLAIGDFKVQVRFDSVTSKPAVAVRDVSIADTEAAVDVISDSPYDLELDNIQMGGYLKIGGAPIGKLTISSVHRSTSAPTTLDIRSKAVQTMQVRDTEFDTLNICPQPFAPPPRVSARGLVVVDSFAVGKAFLDQSTNDGPTLERSRLFRLLQDKGVYCDAENVAIGLDAVYFRKLTDVEEVNPAVAFVVKWLTGFGIKLQYPLITLALLICSHFLIRAVVFRLSASPAIGIRIAAKEAILGMVGLDPASGLPASCKSALIVLLYGYNLVMFVQITLCSIYLSQTTLQ